MTWEAWVKPEKIECIIMCKYNTQGLDYNSYWIAFNIDGKFRNVANSAFGGVNTDSITDNVYAVIGQWVYLTSTLNLGGVKSTTGTQEGLSLTNKMTVSIYKMTVIAAGMSAARNKGPTGCSTNIA